MDVDQLGHATRLAWAVSFEAPGMKFSIASISRYPAGEIGEMFIDPAKPGSTINTLVHDMAIAFSFAVQHGASAADILRALRRAFLGLSDIVSVAAAQSFHQPLNRVGASSVYRTVCWIFLWPR